MKTLWRFTVSVIFTCVISTVTTSESEEVLDDFPLPETIASDENDSKLRNEETNIQDDYLKSLNDDYERRTRLQTIHENLATKLQKALVKKLNSPEYSKRLNLTAVEKFLSHDDIPNGRRSFNREPESIDEENHSELSDGRRNYVKKVTYVIGHPVSAQVINLNDENLQDLQAVNVAGTRAGYTLVTNNNGIKTHQPYDYLNNNPKIHISSLPYYVYEQPYMDFTNPIKMYFNYYPGNRYIKFNNNFFDYTNHVKAQNHLNDYKHVTDYVINLMTADNYVNPNVIQILKSANDLNLAEINNFDTSQLVQIDKSDLIHLKRYIIMILNKYGMTPYVFKLLEYVNLLDGRPRNEIYLVFKILSNQQAVYGLNKIESDQLKSHLQYLLNEYGKSPYITPFVRNIGGLQYETKGNILYYFDFGDLDPSRNLNTEYMRKIYLHLTQIYRNNKIIQQILQNINRIYDNRYGLIVLPKLDLNDYQNLYYLSQNDLYLLTKYISQIEKQRGDHTYLNELLIYLNKLQNLETVTEIKVIKDVHNGIKELDLTGLYKILTDINNVNGLKPEITVIINRLMNMKTVTLNDRDKIINDLKALKDYLLQQQMYIYDQLLIKVLYELNNLRKDEVLPPIEDNEKWIDIKVQDLELIYKYLLSNAKFKINPYIIMFVNEIIQIIQRAKLNPYANITYKFRYSDLQKLYNNIHLYVKDKENPINVLILHYLDQGEDKDIPKHSNETIPNADLHLLKEFFGDDQINLNIIYKFILYQIEKGNQNEVLLELLQLLKTTLLLPNGELKINVINLNETEPYEINSNDLQKLYMYLQKLIEDNLISVDLLEFYRRENRKHKLNVEIFYNATKESLNRLRNFLLVLIKDHGENPYILELIMEINSILEIPDNVKYIINNNYPEVNEEDLLLLIKYFSVINLTDNNNAIINILEYLQDTKDNIEKGHTKDWVYINVQDLEVIYQYLLGKEKFLHSPYLVLFVNEILPLIQRGKQNPYEKINYKFKYEDLLQLYNLILSDERDKENPVYIKIVKYLNIDTDDTKTNNGTIPNVDLYILKEYFGDQINLDLLYKFLTHEVESGTPDELIFELLQFIKRTFILPNGRLLIKTINLDDTKPLDVIQPKDLQILYLFLQKLIKHEFISVKLLEYMEKQKQKEKLIQEILSNVPKESLIRIRNYLLTLLKEIGENQFVLHIFSEINSILGIPRSYDKHERALNGTEYEINEVGIELLIKYFTEINESGDNSDLNNILSYLYETQNGIYAENNTKDKLVYINVNDLKEIYEYLLGKEKFINSPYLVIFINEILPLIQQGKLNPYENLANKIKHIDLQTIFNLIVSQERDKANPIYKKIVKYLDLYKDDKNNDGTQAVDLHVLHEYFGEDQVNLDIVHKFLVNEINSGNTNEVLTELLQFMKKTLLLPNGLLKIKIIYFNQPELTGQITWTDLQKLYFYLQKLMEDDNTRIKLLDYTKTYRQIFELLSNASKVSLNRIRNFLLILMKELGENPYIAEVLSEVNVILGIPESKNDQLFLLNGTKPEVKEEDLKLLIEYFTLINSSNKTTDVIKILEFLHETEENNKNEENEFNEQWVYFNAEELQQLYQYLLGKESFINSPYSVLFVNEILPFIHKAKQRTYENLLYKFKYIDLLNLYKTVLSHERDKENPVYIMILEYLDDFTDDTKTDNVATPDVDFDILNDFFEDNKIDLEILYKFLSHEIESGSHSKVLVQLLQLIKRTLLLPNGQLKVQVIHINGTDPNIHPNDLQKLYFYLQKLIENEILSIEFLDYIKKYKQKEKDMHNILIDINPESLIRIRNFLLILMKELGDNPFVVDVLHEINHIIGVPESNDKQPQILNGTNYQVNEKDLELLIKYFSEINIYGKNSDLINILDYVQDNKENAKHNKEDSNGQWVSVNVHELEVIYQYLLSKEKFLNSPYTALFINEIRPLVQLGKEHPNEVVIYKFRAMDLLNIYKFLISQENDKENPIFIKILHYLEQATNITKHDNGTKVDPHVLNEYFGDNQINLDIVYKFLLHKIKTGNPSTMLVELLEVLKRIQLPNGELKIKIIKLNETVPKQINPNDLEEIYLYLQRIINDNTLSIDLLEYYTKNVEQYKKIIELLSKTPKESLNRLRNYLLILVKEGDGNSIILEIILEINQILGFPENDDKQRYDKNVDENDLEILEKALSLINGLDDVDIMKIIEKIIKTKKVIKEEQERAMESKLFKTYILDIINNKNNSPDVKFILEYLLKIGLNNLNQVDSYSEFDLVLNETIANLSLEDLNVLEKYLQMLIHKFKSVYLVEILLPHIKKTIKDIKDSISKPSNETLIVNVTRHDLDVFNKYLLELIKQYGENPNILQIIYKINNIKEIPNTENDWIKLITNNTNMVPTIKVDDINEIIKYLLDLIEKQGATPQLIKILLDFSKIPKETIEVKNRKVTPLNITHTSVVLNNNDANKIKSYLVKIINDYGSNPYLVNILKVLSPKRQDNDTNKNQTNVYTFTKLNQNDLKILTQYILQLINKGASPEIIEILNFIYEVNGDVNDEEKENNNEQYVLEISKEIKKLQDNNIIQTMRNMDRNSLIKLYIDMLEIIFNNQNINNDLTRIMVKLLEMYKKEDSPIKKYIILKWYEYLIRNKGVSYKTLRNPDFINNLLELDVNNVNDEHIIITTENKTIVKPHDYSSDIDKILSELIDNTLRDKPTIDLSEEDSRKMNDNTESKPDLRNRIKETKIERKSCIEEKSKSKNILKVFNKIKKEYRHDVDISNDDLEIMFDIIVLFAKQLKQEKHKRRIPIRLVLDELEHRLLSEHTRCEQSDTVKQIISTVVTHLRDIISYLKAANFSKDEIMRIVKSTLEDDIMPDIKAISVQECSAAANKEILEALLSNVYVNTYE